MLAGMMQNTCNSSTLNLKAYWCDKHNNIRVIDVWSDDQSLGPHSPQGEGYAAVSGFVESKSNDPVGRFAPYVS
jgi:hypothetical protein